MNIVQKLCRRGILGLNRRNARYEARNSRALYPLVDDKIKTKRLAQAAGLAVPELYAVVETNGQVDSLPAVLAKYSDFVVKPATGSGGKGVIVIAGRMKELYCKISGGALSWPELRYHVLNILSGMYSLGGHMDRLLVEYRVQFDSTFAEISYLGVPDIRIIVFLGIPVMAMVRLPTRFSDGKANLHQGAVGAGIDLASGKTLAAVWRDGLVYEHPDTGQSVVGVEISNWTSLLALASRCYELSGLEYQGVDIVLDRDRGPLLLELNARPGLNIQIANRAGLLPRLKAAEGEARALRTTAERVAFAQERFAADKLEVRVACGK